MGYGCNVTGWHPECNVFARLCPTGRLLPKREASGGIIKQRLYVMRGPVLPRQQYAPFSPQGYLERARWWLTSEEDASILYTSLELRYAFETIVVKHGWASGNDTKSFDKLHYKPVKMFATLREEFSSKIDIDKSYRFFLEGTDKSAELVVSQGLKSLEPDGTLTQGYFLTVPQELFSLYGKLDDNLHGTWAGRDVRLPQRPWYTVQYKFLSNFANRLLPHASSHNDLSLLDTPGVKWEEVKSNILENLLRQEGQHPHYA